MLKSEMATKLWDLANVTTGYIAVQSIGLMYALAKGDLVYSLRGTVLHGVAIALVFITAIISCLVIHNCFIIGRILAQENISSDESKLITQMAQILIRLLLFFRLKQPNADPCKDAVGEVDAVWRLVNNWRIVFVILFSLATVGVIFGHLQHPPKSGL